MMDETGMATISPPEQALACRGEDHLELTCAITGRLLEWSFDLIPEGESTATRYTRVLQSLGPSNQVALLTVNSDFSTQDSLPLRSRLLISPVRDDMNGTVVNCTDLFASISASVITNLTNRDQSKGKYSEIKCVSPLLSLIV